MPLWHNRHVADARGPEQDGKPTEPASRHRKTHRDEQKTTRVADRQNQMRRKPFEEGL